MAVRVLAALCAAACAAGCGGGEAPRGAPPGACEDGLGSGAQAIRGGALDGGDPAVVAVNTLDVDCQRGGAPACTGTLVAPDLVLTAAHCLGEMPASSFGVLFGATADAGLGALGEGLEGAFFRVAEIRVAPGFDPGTLANDAALLRLDGEADAPPVPRIAAPLDGGVVGAAARVVGFGVADEAPSHAKREGTVTVTELAPGEIVYRAGPAMTCAGDSGGPVLVAVDGVERLAAVTSRGDAACEEYGVGVRLDALPASFFEGAW